MVLRNAFVTIAGWNASSRVRSVEINESVVKKDQTVMGNTANKQVGGLGEWTISVVLVQDYAAGGTTVTVRPLVGTDVALVVRPDAGVVSPTNPQWAGTGFLASFKPIDGKAGDVPEVTAVFENAGTVLVYTTA